MAPRAIVVAALLMALVGSVAAQGAPDKMGIWIPMYTSPSPEFAKMLASVEGSKCLENSFHGTVLAGPNSGPPNIADAEEDKLYRNQFEVVANTSQWTAFGYVTTRYMERPLDEVIADINTWLTPGTAGYGDSVQGIWVDNTVSNFDEASKKYYGAVMAAIRKHGKMVALNPGTDIRDCEVAGQADFVNNFEDYYTVWAKNEKDRRYDCPCKEVTRCIASIHAFDPKAKEADLAKTMRMMSARGYKAMFITDRIMPRHYEALPTFWPEVVGAACQTNIGQGNMDNAGQTTYEGTNVDPVDGPTSTTKEPIAAQENVDGPTSTTNEPIAAQENSGARRLLMRGPR